MARNYNKVIIIGKIESEIVLRQTTNGTPVTNFTVTTTNKWTDKNGDVKDYKNGTTSYAGVRLLNRLSIHSHWVMKF